MNTRARTWLHDCKLLARAAGLHHDVGKAGVDFQEKIRADVPLVDPVRHEWISLFVIREMLAGKSWQEAWDSIQTFHPPQDRWTNVDPFDKALEGMKSVLLYLIATHHRLPTMSMGINHYHHVRDDDHIALKKGDLGPEAMEAVRNNLAEVIANSAKDGEKDRLYWRSVAMLSRVALILADHSVSMQKLQEPDNESSERLFANTDRETKKLNQPLDWHLLEVGRLAAEMVDKFESFDPPSLSPEVVQRICSDNSKRKAFLWQKRAHDALAKSRQKNKVPHLVLNMAATGTGKTRGNVRIACALGNPDGTGIRISTALNLRTLTLQTRDAYAQQLNIPPSELTGIIGDKATLKLYNYQQQQVRKNAKLRRQQAAEEAGQLIDDDENLAEPDFESISNFRYTNPPEWLKGFLAARPGMASVIGAPALVSTVDFLISAGEPQMQGNHALAMLRLKSSDLILDEIDSYDPMAFLAVLRLVMTSAYFGRNVIASSATLSRPVARMLWASFQTGIEMRARKEGCASKFVTAIIDDETRPTVTIHRKATAFMVKYEAHVKRMLKKLSGKSYRRTCLQEVRSLSERGWKQEIVNGCNAMHLQNCWMDPKTGKKVSIGLVRIANIHVAVSVAAHLSKVYDQQARVVCYHSQHFMMQRFFLEHKLDILLTRKAGSAHILQDPEVRAAIDSATTKNVLFIVVATPVEEIGRDHDFDWAVIEPSSTQSLVQTAGRVNRHRMKRLGTYRYRDSGGVWCVRPRCNVAILQYNYRTIIHMMRKDSYTAFCQPGLEMKGFSYPSHNMLELLDWDILKTEQLDARQRFYEVKKDGRRKENNGDITHRYSFATLDDEALEMSTADIFRRMMGTTRNGNEWMGLNTYLDSPLREQGQGTVIMTSRRDKKDGLYLCRLSTSTNDGMELLIPGVVPRVKNDWLIRDEAELVQMAVDANLVIDDAMRVNMSIGELKRDGTIKQQSLLEYAVHHRSFGFYRNKQR